MTILGIMALIIKVVIAVVLLIGLAWLLWGTFVLGGAIVSGIFSFLRDASEQCKEANPFKQLGLAVLIVAIASIIIILVGK